jgi:transcriptional regulator with XRE-family HTH domain
MENKNLAHKVKDLRKRKALSQDDLAKNSGLSLRTVQRVENGDTIPTAETLKRLALVLDVAPNELTDFIIDGETSKQRLKTKYEYLHIFESKLIFSKTPEINLVEDYTKSIGYCFRTLMVFFVFIPLFLILAFVFYNIQRMDLVVMSASVSFFFLIMAFNTMLFASGTPVIDIQTIRSIKIKKILLKFMAVEILFIESGRIKERGLILEKDQVDVMIERILVEKLITEDDIKINKKIDKYKPLFIFLMIVIFSILCNYTGNAKLVQYFYGLYFFVLSLYLTVRMLRNSVFLSSETKARGYRAKDKIGLQKL